MHVNKAKDVFAVPFDFGRQHHDDDPAQTQVIQGWQFSNKSGRASTKSVRGVPLWGGSHSIEKPKDT